jgi:Protein of unknown function (DUF3168)
MASAEAALFSILTTDSAVAAIVGTRVYPDLLPQGVTYPAIRTQRISTPRSPYRALDGVAGYASPRMQIDCCALSRSSAITLAQAVYAAVEGYHDTVNGLRVDAISTEDEGASVETDIGPNGAAVYDQRLDVVMFHPE